MLYATELNVGAEVFLQKNTPPYHEAVKVKETLPKTDGVFDEVRVIVVNSEGYLIETSNIPLHNSIASALHANSNILEYYVNSSAKTLESAQFAHNKAVRDLAKFNEFKATMEKV